MESREFFEGEIGREPPEPSQVFPVFVKMIFKDGKGKGVCACNSWEEVRQAIMLIADFEISFEPIETTRPEAQIA